MQEPRVERVHIPLQVLELSHVDGRVDVGSKLHSFICSQSAKQFMPLHLSASSPHAPVLFPWVGPCIRLEAADCADFA